MASEVTEGGEPFHLHEDSFSETKGISKNRRGSFGYFKERRKKRKEGEGGNPSAGSKIMKNRKSDRD